MSEVSEKKKWEILQVKVNELKISQAFDLFRKEGIEPILIKGYAIARLYPDISDRQYVDIDLAVCGKDFEKANEVLKTSKSGLHIDLHKGFRHLDTVSWDILFENSELIGEERNIRVLSSEDHLRILCVHWLTDGGEVKERLWDIYHAVDSRPKDFDWSKCLDVVSDNRRKWILTVIGLAQKYLDLNLDDLEFDEDELKAPKWLIKELEKQWDHGIRIVPLEHCLNDREMLWKQIKKRIPPNPIHATIDMNGKFDNKPRIIYQIGNFFYRIPNSFKRIRRVLRSSYKQ